MQMPYNNMMQLTTSKRISLTFTLYTICIVFFFGIAINAIFFQQRYQAEDLKIQVGTRLPDGPGGRKPRFQQAPVQTIQFTPDIAAELQQNTIIRRLAKIDDEYILYARHGDIIKVSTVTRLVEAQLRLIQLFIILMIVFAVATYLVSLFFVKSSLKNIQRLVSYVDALDIHTLDKPVPLEWPEDDEIRKIATALQNTLNTIKEQTDSLKDFVTHASHELKTPLMSLSATMDAAHKTGKYADYIPKLKSNIQSINNLFDTLLSITKREHHAIRKSPIDIVPIIQTIRDELQTMYANKKIISTLHIPKEKIISSHVDICRIIFHNIMQNAYKYTPNWGTVDIKLDKNTLTIVDTGPGIPTADQQNIRQKFRKNNTKKWSSQWFGLGLYLVQLLVKKQWRKISVANGKKSGAVFTITFH